METTEAINAAMAKRRELRYKLQEINNKHTNEQLTRTQWVKARRDLAKQLVDIEDALLDIQLALWRKQRDADNEQLTFF